MREVFHQSLDEVQSRLVEISELVADAIDKATQAFAGSAMVSDRKNANAARQEGERRGRTWTEGCDG